MKEIEEKVYLNKDEYITCRFIDNNSKDDFDLMYLHGFYSGLNTPKGELMMQVAKENGINFIGLDYLGFGRSSGKPTDYSLDMWFDNVKTCIEKYSRKKLLLMGSSMGSWLCFLTALKYKEKVAGMINLSTAMNFFNDVIVPRASREDWNNEIFYEITEPDGTKTGKLITKKMLEDSHKYNLFAGANPKIELNIPIKLIHGTGDILIPHNTSMRLMEIIMSDDVSLTYIKNATHKLKEPMSLEIIKRELNIMIEKLRNK